jgi:hypothetical protein
MSFLALFRSLFQIGKLSQKLDFIKSSTHKNPLITTANPTIQKQKKKLSKTKEHFSIYQRKN